MSHPFSYPITQSLLSPSDHTMVHTILDTYKNFKIFLLTSYIPSGNLLLKLLAQLLYIIGLPHPLNCRESFFYLFLSDANSQIKQKKKKYRFAKVRHDLHFDISIFSLSIWNIFVFSIQTSHYANFAYN